MARIEPLLATQTEFSYQQLKELAGVDILSYRGRAQFYKFRKQALKDWQIWFENVSGFGYSVIEAGAHPKASLKRVGYARRKISLARAINELVRLEQMTPEQRALQAQTAVLLHDLAQSINNVGRTFAAAASKLHLSVTTDDVKRIGDGKKD